VTFLLEFAQRWLGGLSGVMLTFLGFLLCSVAVGAFWHRRILVAELVAWLCTGLVVVFYPFFSIILEKVFQLRIEIPTSVLFGLMLAAIIFVQLRKSQDWQRDGNTSTVIAKASIFSNETPREIRGTHIGAPIVIVLAVLAVLVTGLSAPQVMVGDEVTHYYMLTHQAEDLTKPNFFAEIPMANGENETRRYPHSFIWHYVGALVFYFTSGSFAAIQIYQAFFFFQLLTAAYLLARDRQGVESRSALAFVLVLASLPLCLIFSVTFYQDVPMTAQILTAFFLLRRGKWMLASLFMSLAIGLKVTAVLFYPSFFFMVVYWQMEKRGWLRGGVICFLSVLVVLGFTWALGRTIVTYGHSEFYPQAQMQRLLKKTQEIFITRIPVISKKIGVTDFNTNLSARPSAAPSAIRETEPVVIANHPGDLRVRENFLVYGGIIMWLVVLYGLLGKVFYCLSPNCLIAYKERNWWLYLVGGSYTFLAAWYIRTSPDARFFLPGLPFLLLPLVEKSVCLPKPKVFISILAAMTFLQGSYVLQKTYKLRALSPELQEGIRYLREHPPTGNIFMYPEGNYRFFPTQHEWYLGYLLRDFWKADNDVRLKLLEKFNISLLVIKKYLIAPVDEEITNLGVYPIEFVREINIDPRFKKVFENKQLIIFQVPSSPEASR
jgi:hypothetical protein